ncbi:hypothetical protein [Oricola thermophila]|uniref:Porin n=1 Tax=Oricola thermophila TaxID=2742145 RepID=A0A6N1VEG9_9HYPH|nr:hypothetical protein [Oricola thermophila]QKV17417.1 hypothetical protein HTY61_02520 [Oricola thermophila]
MKAHLVVAIIAASAVPAYATDQVANIDNSSAITCSGHVEAYYGELAVDDGIGRAEAKSHGGDIRANCNFHQRWNAQGDLFVDAVSPPAMSAIKNYGAAVHVYWRDPSTFAAGGFARIERFDEVGPFDDNPRYSFGLEGQAYLDRVTLYGQAYTGRQSFGATALDMDFWGVRGMARYFATDNLRFEGEVGYRDMGNSFGRLNTVTYGAEVAYRFENTPVSLFGRYQFDHMTDDLGIELDTHKYAVGLRLSFGSRTLLEEDRHGATMDTPRMNNFMY